jgi:hypothetical protein
LFDMMCEAPIRKIPMSTRAPQAELRNTLPA